MLPRLSTACPALIRHSTAATATLRPVLARCMSSDNKYFQSLVGVDVHGRTDDFRNRPLFRRGGKDRKFKTGEEAASLLIKEVIRREPNNREFARDVELIARYLAPVFDRDPKYAWAMKHLVEPERVIQFRVPWIDRDGNNRINRGIRVQHSSSLGPMLGGIRLDKDCNINILRTLAFNQTLQNSLTGFQLGTGSLLRFCSNHVLSDSLCHHCLKLMHCRYRCRWFLRRV
jgi:hypothetical protein